MSKAQESDAQWLPAAWQGRLSAEELAADALWPALSSGARRLLLAKAAASGQALGVGSSGRHAGEVARGSADGTEAAHVDAPAGAWTGQPVERVALAPLNILVNDPGEDAGSNNITQSEPSLAVRLPNVVVSFNDSRVAAHGCGVARSVTGGATFIDEGSTAAESSADGVLTVDTAGDFFFAFLNSDAKGRPSV